MSQLDILGYLTRQSANGGLLGARSNIKGKMMVLGRKIQLLAGNATLNPSPTSVREMSEKIKYIPATGINELARHPKSGYRGEYG